VKGAFAPEEIAGYHCKSGKTVVYGEIQIGDSVLEMGEAHGQWQPMPTMLYLYVNDVDLLYRKAISAARSVTSHK